MAPPGMGKRPIRAGKKTSSSERERIWARMARMNRSDWPEAEYRALKARMTAMSYENMRNAIGLLKLIAAGETDVREGRVVGHDDVFDTLEDDLKAAMK